MTSLRTAALAISFAGSLLAACGPCQGEELALGLCGPDAAKPGEPGWCTRHLSDPFDLTSPSHREAVYETVLCFREGPEGPVPSVRISEAEAPTASDDRAAPDADPDAADDTSAGGDETGDSEPAGEPLVVHWERTLQLLGFSASPAPAVEPPDEDPPEDVPPDEEQPPEEQEPMTATRIFFDELIGEVVIEVGNDDMDPGTARWLLVHAMTHALQDRELDLDAYLDAFSESTDTWLGVQSVVRGEAMHWANVMDLDLLRLDAATTDALPAFYDDYTANVVAGALSSDEPYQETTSVFPYAFGGDMVLRAYQEGGAAAITALLEEPPRAATVPMARGELEDIAVATMAMANQPLHGPPGAWEFLGRDVMGAWGVFLMLARGAGETDESFESALKGWRGDRLWIYYREDPAETAVMWQIRWADEAAAQAFALAWDGAPGGLDATMRVEVVAADTFLVVSDELAVSDGWLDLMVPF